MDKISVADLELRALKIELKELDVHDSKRLFIDFLKNKVAKLNESESKDTLLEYASWHIGELEESRFAFASAKRSLEIALDLTDYCKNINDLNTKEIEGWWDKQLTRKTRLRTGGDNKKEGNKKLESGSTQKLQSQAGKFIKFIIFLKKGKPLSLFNTEFIDLPEELQFLSQREKKPKKAKQKPRVSQDDISRLITQLKDGTTIGEATALMVSMANSVGARYSELASLQLKDCKTYADYVEISFPQSKTIPRVVIDALSKPLLLSWVSRIKNNDDKNAYVFSTKEGTLIAYENMRKKLKDALAKMNLEWKEASSFHYLRHLWVARSLDWPDALRSYWLGWQQKGMMAVYGDFSVEKCKPYYFAMLRNEKNPMLDKKLSILEAQQKSQDEIVEEMIERKLQAYLAKRKA